MHIFNDTVLAFQEMNECPDPVSLEEYRLQQLTAEEAAEIERHLADCQNCQRALTQLQQTSAQPPLESKFEARQTSPEHILPRPAHFEQGQIWLSRAEVSLSDYHLEASNSRVIPSSFMRHFLILEPQGTAFGNPAYQRLLVVPVSEYLTLATEYDLILEAQHSPFGVPVMLEFWNQQSLLALHLEQYLGSVDAASLQLILKLRQLYKEQQPLAGSGLPRGGQILNPDGPHARFQELEKQQALYLQAPLQALHQLESFSQRCFLQIAYQQLKKPAVSEHHPLVPASLKQAKDEVLLAAANDLAQLEPALDFKEQVQLAEDLLLDIWLEGPHLEFYCHSFLGAEIADLEISLFDAEGQKQVFKTDRYGGLFIPLAHFAVGSKTLLYLSLVWQAAELRFVYPLEFAARS